ncbi:MAG TPA: hypothetical protein VF128_07540, partial [Gemmatimonadaceae bacterium]
MLERRRENKVTDVGDIETNRPNAPGLCVRLPCSRAAVRPSRNHSAAVADWSWNEMSDGGVIARVDSVDYLSRA